MNVPINTCSVYLMHQQGVGGYLWMRGGKNPYGSIDGLKDAVKQNVSKEVWEEAKRAGLTESEDGLRDTLNYYWSRKFGGDVTSDTGDVQTLADFTKNVDSFTQKVNKMREERKKLYRKGILRDIKAQNVELEKTSAAYRLKAAEKTVRAIMKTEGSI
jgi:hypothetical protein